MKEFKKKVEVMQKSVESAESEIIPNNEESNSFEHVNPEDDATEQALADADANNDEAARAGDEDINIPTEEPRVTDLDENSPTINDSIEKSNNKENKPNAKTNSSLQQGTLNSLEEEPMDLEDNDELEKNEQFDNMQIEENSGMPSTFETVSLLDAENVSNNDMDLVKKEMLLQTMRSELEVDFKTFCGADNSEKQACALELWKRFEVLTSTMAMQLCDQLRIILEPSLATKLGGDYRNGKRINMKKVIPYIASQFRKDKIWLRRTKPSKRQYQVLLAIDDSSSMFSNGAGRLAMETISVLCKALTTLEVGQLGVVSLGEKMRILHPFEEPFNEQSGSFVLSNFTFQKDAPSFWPTVLDTIISYLDSAKKSSSSFSEQNLQLVFMISDARNISDRYILCYLMVFELN